MKRIISLFIIIAMLIISIPVFAISGEGKEANPYLVATPQDVIDIHNDLNGYYKLTADIDMSGIDFEPIGNESEGAFTGTIDGDGHAISNLTIEDYKYCGFIGYMDGGTVKNVKLEEVSVLGFDYIGGITAYLNQGYIASCSVSGNIMHEKGISAATSPSGNAIMGGIVGWNGGTVSFSTNYANVDSNFICHSGGIAGDNIGEINTCTNYGSINCKDISYGVSSAGIVFEANDSLIVNCLNKGKVRADDGGAAGIVCLAKNSTILGCRNMGSVIAETNAGGIVGTGDGITISQCYNSGNIIATYTYAAGIISSITNNKSNINHCINVGSVQGGTGGGSEAGIVSLISRAEGTQVTNCFNSGTIVGFCNNTSGIVGQDSSSGSSITKCHFSGRLYSSRNRYGKIIRIYDSGLYTPTKVDNCVSCGYSPQEAEARENYNYFQLLELGNSNYSINKDDFKLQESFDGLDFENTWYIDPNTNSGFPQLRNMPRNIQLNEMVEMFEVGDSDKLIAYLDGVTENVNWSSDDETIATISADGTVTAKSIGACTVTATNDEGMKANCLIYVYGRAESISLNKSETSLAIGSTETLTYTQLPSTANENVTWHSEDETIATVSQSGWVTAKKSGKTTISAITINSEVIASCEVTVTGKPITWLSISPSSTTINTDETKQLSLSISPSAYEGKITWSSTDENVVTIDANQIILAWHIFMRNQNLVLWHSVL